MANDSAWLLAALALAGGCLSPRLERQKPSGRVGYLGVEMCPAEEGLRVPLVVEGSPAAKAGIQAGDLLTAFQGQDLGSAENRRALLWEIRNGAGRPLELSLKRGNQTRSVRPSAKRKDQYPQEELSAALTDELMSGEPVSVAVVATSVSHTHPEFFRNAQAQAAWKEAAGTSLRNLFEGMLLKKWFLHCGNFGVVDRDKTTQVLEELRFQAAGAVSPETARRLGKMTGASHLLFVSLTRFQSGKGSYEDEITARLVGVESDSVLASVRFRQPVPAQ